MELNQERNDVTELDRHRRSTGPPGRDAPERIPAFSAWELSGEDAVVSRGRDSPISEDAQRQYAAMLDKAISADSGAAADNQLSGEDSTRKEVWNQQAVEPEEMIPASVAAGSGHQSPGENIPRKRRRNPEAIDKEREKEETSEMWWRFVVKLLLVAAILAAVFRFALGIQIQHGNRMYPYLMDGDLIVTFKLEAYREGDVVAYRRPDTGQIALSRIVAKGPGEIRVEGGHLLVNGNVQEDSAFYTTNPLTEYGISYPLQLGANGYFLLDDNRPIGSDSRAFGEVSQWELMGKVIYVFRRRGI